MTITDSESERVMVRDYMTTNVTVAHPWDRIRDVVRMIVETGHDGFPVVDDGRVVGYISSKDILLNVGAEFVRDAMNKDVIVAIHNMSLSDVARVMFRSGKSKLPVINNDKSLTGIITNTDIVRSHIERSSPKKVWKFKRTLEVVHQTHVAVRKKKISIDKLVPTQPKVYADELEGRIYELGHGLTEPLIVIKKPNGKLILVDGHHRVVAANRLGIKNLNAYILELEKDVPLGMEKTAMNAGLKSINDIKVMDYVRHPLIEVTTRLVKGGEYTHNEWDTFNGLS